MDFIKTNTIHRAGKLGLMLVMLLGSWGLFAQESADKIIIVIGRNRIILQSDLEKLAADQRQQDPGFTDDKKCMLLQSMIMQKMLLEQAERDSISVTDDDVDGQLDNRLRYFIQLYGSKEKLEQSTGKSVYQIKEEFRENIKEQMIADKMQNQILENVKTTPAEVGDFYRKIPQDSLPFFPSTVEVGQIVINPPVSREIDEYAHKTLEDIRKDIIDGKITFEYAASRYSDDPGSRDNGGRYDGITRTGPMVAEFNAAAFKLQNGEISPIFKTKFGYHIVQMISRKGDQADVRHILIKPQLTTSDFKIALAKLDSIYDLLVNKKMTFEEGVGKFSDDEAAKRTGGMVTDPQTGTYDLDITKLDPGMVLMLDSLTPGGFSKPHVFYTESHEQSCRIVYLRNRTSPHKANLKDDYSKIQEVTLAQKKQLKMQAWLKAKTPSFYIKIDPAYQDCEGLKELKINTNKGD